MASSLTATCPSCNATISDDARACARCGADVSVWPDTGPTPLILPGNPAFSADLARRKPTSVWVLGGVVAGIAVALGSLFYASLDEERDEPSAMAVLVEPRAADPAPTPAPVDATPITTATDQPLPDTLRLPPIPDAATLAAERTSSVTAGPAAPIPATPVPPVPAPRAAAVPPTVATPGRTPAPVAAVASVASAPRIVPVLRLVPLVSDSLRPGELLRLRWSVQDRASGRPLPGARIEFTSSDARIASVDRRNGTVTARSAGRVTIIADAGAAGTSSLALVVRTPPEPVVRAVAAGGTEALQARTEAARSASVTAPPRTTPAAVPAPTPPPTPPAPEARRDILPNDDDVRTAVDRLVNEVRRGGSRTFELIQFYADGDEHRVSLVRAPTTVSTIGTSVRVAFEMRLTKFDGAGRPVSRLASVAMNVDKRDGALSTSAVAISALRKP